MEKHIMGENGISYTLGEDGLYYPDLYLPEETEYPIGKYGMLRKTYLKEHRKGLYLELVIAGKLNEHLHQIDEECRSEESRTFHHIAMNRVVREFSRITAGIHTVRAGIIQCQGMIGHDRIIPGNAR